MAAISTIRHKHLFDPDEYKGLPISIIGCGAIGSRVFMALIELGLEHIRCFDFDKVEAHNLANQAFLHTDIGRFKSLALMQRYQDKTGARPPIHMEALTTKLPSPDTAPQPAGIVFLMTDSFDSRRDIANTCLKDNARVFRVFDARMGSTHGEILHFNPNIQQEYESWLKTIGDDSLPAETSPCGSSVSVGTTASIMANLAVIQMVHFLTNPVACDSHIKVFLKPTVVAAETLK